MLDLFKLGLYLVFLGAILAVGIGILAGLPTFIIALGLKIADKVKNKEQGTDGYTAEDIAAGAAVYDAYNKTIKEYNITDSAMQNKLMDEIAKTKGYVFKDGKLVKLGG